MIEEQRLKKKNKKISVLVSTQMDNKLNEICDRMDRSKSGLIRLITLEWMERMLKKG